MTITISPGIKADAGPNLTLCIGNTVKLDGKSAGGTWSGGNGIFSDATDTKATYKPTAAEEAAG
jgi:hypothetical protein